MARKAKVGKNRQDKFYQLAKEQGFRSRASFKLVQLNRRFYFLSSASQGVLDLCAAPGGWLQVARKYMPVAAPCIGVDLVPIRPIPGVHTIAADITTDACRAAIRRVVRETHPGHDTKFDAVLNDGSPNMGTAWLQDAYSQAELTLHALRLATDFLRPGGAFVTKVFRSTDYNSLLFAFHQLFSRVVATKPAASRNESAEIYVACSGYLAPKSIDPRILDPRHVFQDLDADDLAGPAAAAASAGTAAAQPSAAVAAQKEVLAARKLLMAAGKKKKRAKADGYAHGAVSLFKGVPVAEFVRTEHPLTMLAEASALQFDKDKDAALLAMHETDDEVRESCNDIQVLGRREFKKLLKWRLKARKQLAAGGADAANDGDGRKRSGDARNVRNDGSDDDGDDGDGDDDGDSDDATAEDEELTRMKEKLEARQRREKKAHAKAQSKRQRQVDLKMIMPDDEMDLPTESGLFSLKSAASTDAIDHVRAGATESPHAGGTGGADEEDNDDADDDAHRKRLARLIPKRVRVVGGGEEYDAAMEEQLDDLYSQYLSRRGKYGQRLAAQGLEGKDAGGTEEQDVDGGGGGEDGEGESSSEEEDGEDEGEEGAVEDVERRGPVGRPKLDRAARVWFSNPVFNGILDGDDEAAKGRAGGGAGGGDGEADMDVDEPAEEGDEENVRADDAGDAGDAGDAAPAGQPAPAPKPKRTRALSNDETAEMMAIARALKTGGKHRRQELLDSTHQRHSFADDLDALPPWFRHDDARASQPIIPVTKDEVDAERARLEELKALPSRKEAEARGRKRMKLAKRFEEIKKRANAIADQADVSSGAKMKAIEKLYESTGVRGGKQKKAKGVSKTYVVATPGGGRKTVGGSGGGGGGGRGKKGKGGGRIKYVDKRLKSDKRGIEKKGKKAKKGKARK